MIGNLVVRRSVAADASDIARLVLLSAEHFMTAVFGPGIAHALEEMAAGRGTLFSHEHAWIAEEEGQVRGMILCYSGAVKAWQDPRTGLALLRLLGMDMIRRLGTLLSMQSSIGRIGRDEYYISNVAVFPGHRGKGIGARLIECAAGEAALAGARAVVLDVETDNPDARRLYERLGFLCARETPPVVLGGRTFAFARMSREIGAPTGPVDPAGRFR